LIGVSPVRAFLTRPHQAHPPYPVHPIGRIGPTLGAGAVGVDDLFDLLGDPGQLAGVDLPALLDEQLLAGIEDLRIQIARPLGDGLGDHCDLPGAQLSGEQGVADLREPGRNVPAGQRLARQGHGGGADQVGRLPDPQQQDVPEQRPCRRVGQFGGGAGVLQFPHPPDPGRVQGPVQVFQVPAMVELLGPGEPEQGGLAEQLDPGQHEFGQPVRLLGRGDRGAATHDSNTRPRV
jgi:hypothetical protein